MDMIDIYYFVYIIKKKYMTCLCLGLNKMNKNVSAVD